MVWSTHNVELTEITIKTNGLEYKPYEINKNNN